MENNPARPRQPTTFASQNQTTPLNMRAASIHGSTRINPCTTSHIYRGSRTVTMAREVEGHIVGPMALKDFVERFLPLSDGEKGVTVNKIKLKRMKRTIAKLCECKNEVDMYAPLIDAIKPLCPNFIPYDTHAKPLRNFDDMDVKPDICFYSKKHLAAKTMGISAVEMIAEVKYNINDDAFVCRDALNPLQDSQPVPPTPAPTTPIKPDEAMLTETTLVADDGDQNQQLVEETEEYGDDDDDDDDDDNQNRKPDPKQFESDIRSLSSQGRDTLGQITTYTVAQKAAQFRKHIFSLLIFKKYGRLLFWDWSGVVVTDRFPLTDDYFAEFFWRYNKAAGSERGHDETIEVVNARERAAVSKLGLFEKDARLVKIPVGQDDKQLFYVVEQPYFMGGLSPFGQSTRGFKAYSLQEILQSRKEKPEKPEKPKKLFLKDTWRIIGRFYEHQFYDKLREANVKHIATYRQTSDVPNQETIVQQICEEGSGALGSPKNIRRFHHYRMVFDQYASDLSTFRSTKELVSVFHQALQAHQEAYDAGVLHRDISVGNIMITEPDEPDEPDGLDGLDGPDKNREALLVDWDMAKFTDDNTVGTMERTGTWQFMAARFLLDPQDTTPANFDDDLESFVYVLTWMVLRYTDVDYKPVQLYNTIRDIFIESHLNEEGQETGGLGKFGYLRGSGVLDKANIKNPHLRDLLSDIKDVIAVRFHNERTVPSSSRFTRSNDVLEKKQFLETRKWMITFFQDALKVQTPPWPEDDAAKLNPMQAPAHDTTTLKRSTALRNLAADSDALERKSKRSRKA